MAPQKTSYPKQDIRVLLLEGVSQTAVETFRAAGYTQIEFHEKSLPEDELKRRIAEAHIVGIRSRSHLTAEVPAEAKRLIAEGGLRLNNEPVSDPQTPVDAALIGDGLKVSVGKKKHRMVRLG